MKKTFLNEVRELWQIIEVAITIPVKDIQYLTG